MSTSAHSTQSADLGVHNSSTSRDHDLELPHPINEIRTNMATLAYLSILASSFTLVSNILAAILAALVVGSWTQSTRFQIMYIRKHGQLDDEDSENRYLCGFLAACAQLVLPVLLCWAGCYWLPATSFQECVFASLVGILAVEIGVMVVAAAVDGMRFLPTLVANYGEDAETTEVDHYGGGGRRGC